MMSHDPYRKLIKRVAEEASMEVAGFRADSPGDSPIEELFYVALCTVLTFGRTEYETVLTAEDDAALKRLLQSPQSRTALIVQPQVQIDQWRVDFVVHGYGWPVPPRVDEGWRTLVVECDGHDFHERTKEQAARDRARDRALQERGHNVFRFTGSELWRDPWACAMQVIDWARMGL